MLAEVVVAVVVDQGPPDGVAEALLDAQAAAVERRRADAARDRQPPLPDVELVWERRRRVAGSGGNWLGYAAAAALGGGAVALAAVLGIIF